MSRTELFLQVNQNQKKKKKKKREKIQKVFSVGLIIKNVSTAIK